MNLLNKAGHSVGSETRMLEGEWYLVEEAQRQDGEHGPADVPAAAQERLVQRRACGEKGKTRQGRADE